MSGNPLHLMNLYNNPNWHLLQVTWLHKFISSGAGESSYGFHGAAPVGTFPAAGILNDPPWSNL
jgi:hypothetical protein